MMQGGGWGGLATNLAATPIDLSRYEAVEFYAKGSGQFRLTLGTTFHRRLRLLRHEGHFRCGGLIGN